MVLVVGIASGQRVACDEDGSPKWEPSNKFLVWIALALKWITFIFLYGGVIAVIVAVYTMTPRRRTGAAPCRWWATARCLASTRRSPATTASGSPWGSTTSRASCPSTRARQWTRGPRGSDRQPPHVHASSREVCL